MNINNLIQLRLDSIQANQTKTNKIMLFKEQHLKIIEREREKYEKYMHNKFVFKPCDDIYK